MGQSVPPTVMNVFKNGVRVPEDEKNLLSKSIVRVSNIIRRHLRNLNFNRTIKSRTFYNRALDVKMCHTHLLMCFHRRLKKYV